MSISYFTDRAGVCIDLAEVPWPILGSPLLNVEHYSLKNFMVSRLHIL